VSALAEVERRVAERYRDDTSTGDVWAAVESLVASEAPVLSIADAREVARRVVARVNGLGPLQPLCDDPAVTDVLVNGPGRVWVEREGRLERTEVAVSAEELGVIVERVLGPLGLRLDRTNAVVDGRMGDGSRVSVIGPPLAVDGVVLTIRRFAARAVPLERFAEPPVVDLLESLVSGRANLVVFGGTGSGKTTLLNALAARLPDGERVVTIEDTAELRLPGSHVVRLEARPPNAEGVGEVTIRQLVRAALRLRPDRIVVGEVRGPEAFDMLWAMATGHDGSMSTCHASTAADALRRLETFVLTAGADLPLPAVRAQVGAAIDVLVGVRRLPDGRRVVDSVAEARAVGDGVEVRDLVRAGALVGSPSRSRVDGGRS
jgi:pilus assembly protein CpaF